MDLTHLKYAVEVEKTKSITRAAENLFMGQPNLSRAIRELEDSLGIKIFRRTSGGMIPTEQGEEFLGHAKSILSLVEKIESIHESSVRGRLCYNISSPEAIYITRALAAMISGLPSGQDICIGHAFTDNMTVIDNVSQNGHSLGIIRSGQAHEKQLARLLKERGLAADKILEFRYAVLISSCHTLSRMESITVKDLSGCTEICADTPRTDTSRTSEAVFRLSVKNTGRVLTTDQESRLYMLGAVPSAYMWSPPVPADVLERYRLVRLICSDSKTKYTDLLIYRRDHEHSELDRKFINELKKVTTTLI